MAGRTVLVLLVAAIAAVPMAWAKEECGAGQYRDAHGRCIGNRPNVTVRPPGRVVASPGPVRAPCPPPSHMGPHGHCQPH